MGRKARSSKPKSVITASDKAHEIADRIIAKQRALGERAQSKSAIFSASVNASLAFLKTREATLDKRLKDAGISDEI